MLCHPRQMNLKLSRTCFSDCCHCFTSLLAESSESEIWSARQFSLIRCPPSVNAHTRAPKVPSGILRPREFNNLGQESDGISAALTLCGAIATPELRNSSDGAECLCLYTSKQDLHVSCKTSPETHKIRPLVSDVRQR